LEDRIDNIWSSLHCLPSAYTLGKCRHSEVRLSQHFSCFKSYHNQKIHAHLGNMYPFFKILTTTSKCKTNIKQSLPQKFNIESAKYYEITKCQRQLSVPRHSSCLFSLPLSNKTPHLWNHCSGTYGGSIPFRKESSNASPLTGWEDGTMWPAPLTEANVNPPLYCWTYPPTCKRKHSEVMNFMLTRL